MKENKKALAVFFITVIALSAVVDVLIAKGISDYLYLILMWMPAVAALIASVVKLKENGGKLRFKSVLTGCGFRKCKWRYIFMGCLIPLIYILVPYLLYWAVYPESFFTYATNPVGMCISILLAIIVGDLTGLVSALGEEIGWRGFMVPNLLERFGWKNTLLFSSLFWCLWHFPLILFDDYMSGTPLWYNLISFVLCIFPVGVIAGLLAIESGSVWPSALLHASHNNYDQAIFGLMTNGDNKMYFVSETGIFTIVCVWTIAIIMYLRYRKKQAAVYDAVAVQDYNSDI